MLHSRLRLLTLFITICLLVSCSDKHHKKGESTVTFNIPQFISKDQKKTSCSLKENETTDKGFNTPGRAVVGFILNASGTGFPRIFHQWEGCPFSDTCDFPLPPPQIEFSIPKGFNRLFQIILFVADIDPVTGTVGNEDVIYYGEAIKDLNLDLETIDIFPTQALNTNAREMSVSGRFYDPLGRNLTGIAQALFIPPTGSAPMLVHATEIFNGWFNFFAVEGAQFAYRFKRDKLSTETVTLFDNLSYDTFFPNDAPDIMQVNVPPYYEFWSAPPTVPFHRKKLLQANYQYQDEIDKMIVGHFGSVPTGKQVCYHDVNEPIYTALDYNNNPIGLYTDALASIPLEWDGITSNPDAVSIITGGDPQASCTGTTFVDHIFFEHKNFTSHGNGAIGIEGPFRVIPPTQGTTQKAEFLKISDFPAQSNNPDNVDLIFEWNFLPGVLGGTDGLSGVTLFAKTFPAGSDPRREADQFRRGEGYECGALQSKGGFIPIFDTATGTSFQYNDFPKTSLETSFVILCPYRGDKYFTTALGQELRFLANSFPFNPACNIQDNPDAENTAGYAAGDGTSTIPPQGDFSTGPWIICTPTQLVYFANNWSTNGTHFQLGADIDMSATAWDWTLLTGFSRSFDGANHSIIGLTLSPVVNTPVGMFKDLSAGATITNLNFSNLTISRSTGSGAAGALVGSIASGVSISNINVSGNIDNTIANSATGGVIGKINAGATLSNINMNGSVVGKSKTGGIVGSAKFANVNVNGLHNTAITHGGQSTGGIFGYLLASAGTVNISNLFNSGSITTSSSNAGAFGGILGKIKASTGTTVVTDHLYNLGTISNSGPNSIANGLGGIIGSASVSLANFTLSSAINYGAIGNITPTTVQMTGGIIGNLIANNNNANTTTIKRVKNAGSINANSLGNGLGGIIGNVTATTGNSNNLLIKEVTNTTSATLSLPNTASNAGGIIGKITNTNSSTTTNIEDFVNNGQVIANNTVGGTIGINSTPSPGGTINFKRGFNTGHIQALITNSGKAASVLAVSANMPTLAVNFEQLFATNNFTLAGTPQTRNFLLGFAAGGTMTGGPSNFYLNSAGTNFSGCGPVAGTCDSTVTNITSFHNSAHSVFNSPTVWDQALWQFTGTSLPSLIYPLQPALLKNTKLKNPLKYKFRSKLKFPKYFTPNMVYRKRPIPSSTINLIQ